MRVIDQYALQELFAFNAEIIEAYNAYDFTKIFHAFGDYSSVNLSAFYLEIIKDCLYVEKADDHARRSVQTACWYILDTLTHLMAPIFSFTAEQLSDLYQKDKKESIHLQNFATLMPVWEYLAKENSALIDVYHQVIGIKIGSYAALAKIEEHVFMADQPKLWNTLKAIRSAILKSTEGLREKGEIKRSLDAKITIFIDPALENYELVKRFISHLTNKGEAPEFFFKDFAVLSQFELTKAKEGLLESSLPGLYVKAEKADGVKCPRCWQWAHSSHEHGLCPRCAKLV